MGFIQRAIDHMGSHGGGQISIHPERVKINGPQFLRIGGHHRQFKVTVSKSAPMARNMFHHRHNGPGHQPFCGSTPQRRHTLRAGGIGTIANDIRAARHRHIQHRQAIHSDANVAQIGGHKLRCQMHKLCAFLFGQMGKSFKAGGGGIGRPMRRPHALHPPAFLIDQDGGIRATHLSAEGRGQCTHLLGSVNIAFEQDQSPGLLSGHKRTLSSVQSQTRATTNEGFNRHALSPTHIGPV